GSAVRTCWRAHRPNRRLARRHRRHGGNCRLLADGHVRRMAGRLCARLDHRRERARAAAQAGGRISARYRDRAGLLGHRQQDARDQGPGRRWNDYHNGRNRHRVRLALLTLTDPFARPSRRAFLCLEMNMTTMKTSPAGVALITKWEGLRTTAYQDSG